ncbi:MAG: hypothetical protein ABEJ93_02565 [Candidatus Nanohalobium sp.]
MRPDLNLKKQPWKVKFSTAVLGIFAVLQFIPSITGGGLFIEFFSGLALNPVTLVTMASSQTMFSSVLLGALALSAAVSILFADEGSWIIQFLALGTVSFYGLVSIMLSPWTGMLSNVQIFGLGVQTVFLGVAGLELYKAMKGSDFGFEVHKYAYLAGLWLTVSGTRLVAAVQFLDVSKVSALTAYGFFAFIGAFMIYSAVQLLMNSRHGFWNALAMLGVLLVVSIGSGALLGAVISFCSAILIWSNREDFGVEEEHIKLLGE